MFTNITSAAMRARCFLAIIFFLVLTILAPAARAITVRLDSLEMLGDTTPDFVHSGTATTTWESKVEAFDDGETVVDTPGASASAGVRLTSALTIYGSAEEVVTTHFRVVFSIISDNPATKYYFAQETKRAPYLRALPLGEPQARPYLTQEFLAADFSINNISVVDWIDTPLNSPINIAGAAYQPTHGHELGSGYTSGSKTFVVEYSLTQKLSIAAGGLQQGVLLDGLSTALNPNISLNLSNYVPADKGFFYSLEVVVVPEPASGLLAILAVSLIGLVKLRKRCWKR